MSALTDAEVDSLTECECGHFANEHSSEGCLATDFSEDWRPIRDDDKCSCMHSPAVINSHAVESIVAAREAAAVQARDQAYRPFRDLLDAVDDLLSYSGGLDAWDGWQRVEDARDAVEAALRGEPS